MIYFFLLSSLRKEHYEAVGLTDRKSQYVLNDSEKMTIIANLNAKTKAIIRRDFLIDNFKGAYRDNAIADLLLSFAKKHMPEELANIEAEYNEIYEKRHQRIEERKALLAKDTEPEPLLESFPKFLQFFHGRILFDHDHALTERFRLSLHFAPGLFLDERGFWGGVFWGGGGAPPLFWEGKGRKTPRAHSREPFLACYVSPRTACRVGGGSMSVLPLSLFLRVEGGASQLWVLRERVTP